MKTIKFKNTNNVDLGLLPALGNVTMKSIIVNGKTKTDISLAYDSKDITVRYWKYDKYYPASEEAQAIVDSIGLKTISEKQLGLLTKLGYNVTVENFATFKSEAQEAFFNSRLEKIAEYAEAVSI